MSSRTFHDQAMDCVSCSKCGSTSESNYGFDEFTKMLNCHACVLSSLTSDEPLPHPEMGILKEEFQASRTNMIRAMHQASGGIVDALTMESLGCGWLSNHPTW